MPQDVDDALSVTGRRSEPPTVVLLCGRPASGKTTLARKLVDHYKKSAVHLEYDELEESLASTTSEDDRREAWNGARRMALQQLEEHLGEKDRISRIILIDDNFHLRGMRKQIHRLLLGYRPVRFGILWMETPHDECVRRNQNRTRQIPAHVMEKMNQIIEPPRAAWEEYWLKVDQRTPLESILMFIDECWDIMDIPETLDSEQKQADRQGTLLSQSHNWDKLLRGWVGMVARYDKGLAVQANEARKVVMREMKDVHCEIWEEDTVCARFVSLVMPDGQSENQLKLLQLLKSCK
jgi:tRNA uridine 5-carbamoylmethylation protein Kti12